MEFEDGTGLSNLLSVPYMLRIPEVSRSIRNLSMVFR